MTFSILGHCGRTGMFGVAITTSSICVGARCPWAMAGVGAVATQNITDPDIGPLLLSALGEGKAPDAALGDLIASRPNIDYRQVTVIGRNGVTAHFSGAHTLGIHDVATGPYCIAAGNLLADADVPAAMIAAFSARSDDHLAARLLASVSAGLAAGGEVGPIHSAALLVVHEQNWPLVDLRVDWSDGNPLSELTNLWRTYRPQMNDYVNRALDPATAPAYGVPGNE